MDRQQLPGIIDTFGEAFARLNRRPYLILFPVLIDLYLWLGVGISARPLTERVIAWARDLPNADTTMLDALANAGQNYDLFQLLGVSIPTLVGQIGSSISVMGDRPWITDLAWWAIPLLAVGIILAGLALGMFYLTVVGYLLRDGAMGVGALLRESVRNSLRMIGFVLITFFGSLLLALPLLLFSGALMLVGINAVPLMALIAWLGAMWIFLLLFFAQYAIVVSSVGPLRAIYLSYNVVRRHLWGTAGLIGVSLLMTNGVPIALQVLTKSPVGVVLAMLGNAYIATGVLLAAMLFYRDRVRLLVQPSPPAAPARPV